MPRQPHLADQISSAYDCYLELQRYIRRLYTEALRRPDDWDQNHVCAPCLYKTMNEPALKFSFLAAMDGNNSLKLVDSTFRPGTVRSDNRSSTSFRWLTPEAVNIFKDEVNRKVCNRDIYNMSLKHFVRLPLPQAPFPPSIFHPHPYLHLVPATPLIRAQILFLMLMSIMMTSPGSMLPRWMNWRNA